MSISGHERWRGKKLFSALYYYSLAQLVGWLVVRLLEAIQLWYFAVVMLRSTEPWRTTSVDWILCRVFNLSLVLKRHLYRDCVAELSIPSSSARTGRKCNNGAWALPRDTAIIEMLANLGTQAVDSRTTKKCPKVLANFNHSPGLPTARHDPFYVKPKYITTLSAMKLPILRLLFLSESCWLPILFAWWSWLLFGVPLWLWDSVWLVVQDDIQYFFPSSRNSRQSWIHVPHSVFQITWTWCCEGGTILVLCLLSLLCPVLTQTIMLFPPV